MKKKIIICGVVIIALVCLLPFPQKIERTFFGINTFSGEPAEITLSMNYLRFLFLNDKMSGEITVTSEGKTTVYGSSMFYVGLWPLNNEDKTMHAFTGFYFNPETIMHDYGDGVLGSKVVGSEIANAYISRDFNKILLYHVPSEEAQDAEPKQYIGNIEGNKENETVGYFKGYTRSAKD